MMHWGPLFLFLAAFQLISAQSIPWPAGLEIPMHQAEPNFNTASAPAYINASEFEGGLLRYWPLRTANQPTDTSILFAVVSFDTLIGPATAGTSAESLSDAAIDSIGLQLYHVKTSAIPTRCVLEILPVNENGYPLPQAWYSDTLTWSVSVASPAKRVWIPLQAYPPSNQAWAVRFRLLELGAGDTLQLAARHPVKDTCGNLIQADTSVFYPNSFAFWQGYNLLLPSQSGGDFYTDCNGNGQRDSSDGANPIQTWDIALSVRATGLNLLNFTPNSPAFLYPNPCSEQVHVGLPGCSWDLWDAFGKRRASGVGKAILSCKNLPAGCYVVNIKKGSTFWKEKLCVH